MSVQFGYYLCTLLGIVAGIMMAWLALTWKDDDE